MHKKIILGVTIIFIFILSHTTEGYPNLFLNTPSITSTQILFVGGSGPGNYSNIQSAINDASSGDTVFVYNNNSPYYEHLTIPTTLILKGENRTTTIIDGNHTSDVIAVYADNVQITGFTIQNSGPESMIDAGIELHTDNNLIYDTIIHNNSGYSVGIYCNTSANTQIYNNEIFNIGNEGIYIKNGHANQIYQNTLHHNGHCAIILDNSHQNTITNNEMFENYATLSLWPQSTENEISFNTIKSSVFSGIGIWKESNHNLIYHNHISQIKGTGIIIKEANNNKIHKNIFEKCDKGIILNKSTFNIISQNNFVHNNLSARFNNSLRTLWWRNYWDDHACYLPKIIFGQRNLPWEPDRLINWINIDLFPIKNPMRYKKEI